MTGKNGDENFAYCDNTPEHQCALELATANAFVEQSKHANDTEEKQSLIGQGKRRMRIALQLATGAQLDDRPQLLHDLGVACLRLENFESAVEYLYCEYKSLSQPKAAEQTGPLEPTKQKLTLLVEIATCAGLLAAALLAVGDYEHADTYMKVCLNQGHEVERLCNGSDSELVSRCFNMFYAIYNTSQRLERVKGTEDEEARREELVAKTLEEILNAYS